MVADSTSIVLRRGAAELHLLSLGASIRALHLPDCHGNVEDVVLGHPTTSDYLTDSSGSYFGCTVGRVANRVANATFAIAKDRAPAAAYELEANDGKHALHGGSQHWGRREWMVREISEEEVVFARFSPSGEAGYPGGVDARVSYRLAGPEEGEARDGVKLTITMEAKPEEKTPINMVHHSHWNLGGAKRVAEGGTVAAHELSLASAYYTPVAEDLIPTGELKTVADGPLDFRTAVPLAAALERPGGVDCNFVLSTDKQDLRKAADKPGGMLPAVRPAAVLSDPVSGRRMAIATNAPGMQVYTGNFLDGAPGKSGVTYKRHQSVCLESQAYPNSVNEAAFPGCMVAGGDAYLHVMEFSFSWGGAGEAQPAEAVGAKRPRGDDTAGPDAKRNGKAVAGVGGAAGAEPSELSEGVGSKRPRGDQADVGVERAGTANSDGQAGADGGEGAERLARRSRRIANGQ